MSNAGPFHDSTAEKLDRSALRDLQATKLRALIDAVLASTTNKFYKSKLRKHSFEELPFTTKADIVLDQSKHSPYGTNLTYPLTDYCRFHQTSGSTGTPIRWLDTRESWEWMLRNWSCIFQAAGLKQKDRICFAFSFGPFLGFWTAFESAARYGALCFAGGGMSTSARLRFLLDNGITVLCCTPTYALRMAEVAAEEKINIELSPVRMLIVAGEPGGSIPQTRARIEELWGARCIDHYGMTEVGPACFECEKVRGRLHVIENEYIAECIDPKTGTPVPENQPGELVLTTLGRTGSPLIRFRTGDIVKLVRHAPCACGRSYAALEGGILGRTDDMLVVRGVNIYPSALEDAVRRFEGVVEFQVEFSTVRAMSEVKVRIEPGPAEVSTELTKRVAAELQRAFNIRINVEPVPLGTLPRFEMKAKRWIRKKDEE